MHVLDDVGVVDAEKWSLGRLTDRSEDSGWEVKMDSVTALEGMVALRRWMDEMGSETGTLIGRSIEAVAEVAERAVALRFCRRRDEWESRRE